MERVCLSGAQRVYLSGAISSCYDTYEQTFASRQLDLERDGYIVINPALLPKGLDSDRYMPICLAMIDACDTVYMMRGWEDSMGARLEREYALYHGKSVWYETQIDYDKLDEVFR